MNQKDGRILIEIKWQYNSLHAKLTTQTRKPSSSPRTRKRIHVCIVTLALILRLHLTIAQLQLRKFNMNTILDPDIKLTSSCK